MVEWHGFRLLPFQIQAVDAVRNGHNVLVAAPTGAGKTLVAEYAVEDAVKRGKRVVYTSPIKALSSQKYRDFKEDPAVEVGIMTGDVTLHPRAQVLVMTTEILRNAIFENPRELDDVLATPAPDLSSVGPRGGVVNRRADLDRCDILWRDRWRWGERFPHHPQRQHLSGHTTQLDMQMHRCGTPIMQRTQPVRGRRPALTDTPVEIASQHPLHPQLLMA